MQLIGTALFNDANLQSYYRMEGNSNDSKGSNNGADTAITYSNANGKYAQGASFNGTTSVIDFGDVLDQNTNDFTWVMWVNLPASGNNSSACVISKRQNASPFPGYEIQYGDASGNLQIILADTAGGGPGGNLLNTGSCSFAPDGYYHHLAVVFDRTNSICRVYKDGVQIKTATIAAGGGTGNSGTLKFGLDVTSTYYMNMKLDEVACFNKVLTVNEIQSLAASEGGAALFAL